MNTNCWRLLLLLLCLSLAALPAMGAAIALYNTGTPNFASDGTGTPIYPGAPFFAAGSFQCLFHDCNIEGFAFYTFNGRTGGPTALSTVTWQFDPVLFDFKGTMTGTATVLQIGDCSTGDVDFQYCLDAIDLGKSIDVPMGTFWFWLTNATVGAGADPNVYWADAHVLGQPSTTFTTNSSIEPYPDPKAFAVFGTPTVPEPGSILMLGSGIVGLAGVLRRKLMR